MLATKKYLRPHTVFGELTFEEYCIRIPELYFKPEVPKDVIKNFEVVENMMALSYYEYRLIDEAYTKAIYTFEMAMRIRYRDFFNDPNNRLGFHDFVTKLSDLNLFETGIDVLMTLKYSRNTKAHPDRHTFGGMIYWNRMEYISRLINEMYENRALRSERVSISVKLKDQLRRAGLENSIVMETHDVQTILYKLQLLFVNNKISPPTFLFAYTPLFDLTVEENSVRVPEIYDLKLISPIVINGTLEGISTSTNEKVKFSPIHYHSDLFSEFENWNNEFSKQEIRFRFEPAVDFNLPHIIIPEIQEFQKM
jgi:hypothetical protein